MADWLDRNTEAVTLQYAAFGESGKPQSGSWSPTGDGVAGSNSGGDHQVRGSSSTRR